MLNSATEGWLKKRSKPARRRRGFKSSSMRNAASAFPTMGATNIPPISTSRNELITRSSGSEYAAYASCRRAFLSTECKRASLCLRFHVLLGSHAFGHNLLQLELGAYHALMRASEGLPLHRNTEWLLPVRLYDRRP